MIRVIIDLSRMECQNNKYVWFAVDTTAMDTICEFKTFLCNQFNLKHKHVTLYVKDALLRDEDTILLLREDDVVRVLCKPKKKGKKRKMDSDTNAEELCVILPQDKCSEECEVSANYNSHVPDDQIKRKIVKDKSLNEQASEENEVHQIKTNKKKDKGRKKQKVIEEIPSSVNTSIPLSVNTSVPLSVNTSVPLSVNTSIPSSVNPSIPSSVNTSIPSSVNTSIPSSVNTSIPSSVNTSMSSSVNTSIPSSVNTSVIKPSKRRKLSLAVNSTKIDPINERSTLKKMVCKNVQLDTVSNQISATEGNISVDKTMASSNIDSVDTGNKRRRKRTRRRRRKPVNPALSDQVFIVNEADKKKMVHNDDPIVVSTSVNLTSTPRPMCENRAKHVKFVDFSDDSDEENDIMCVEIKGNLEERVNNINEGRMNIEGKVNEVNITNNTKHKETLNLSSVTCDQTPENSASFENANPDNGSVKCENVFVQYSVDSKGCTNPDIGKNDACEKKETKIKHDEEYKRLNTLPSVGDRIAYKVLELNETYCPEISEYKEGIVKCIEPVDEVLEIELCNEEVKQPREGKFELIWPYDTTSAETVKIVFVKWGDVIDPRLIEKNPNN